MATSIFGEKELIPGELDLAEALGGAKAVWDRLERETVETFAGTRKEWKFYSKKAGWSLVFKTKDKTLFYLIPCKEMFKVWLVLGEKAVRAAAEAPLPGEVAEALRSATAYAEGTSFGLDVKAEEDLEAVRTLLAIKLSG